MALRAPDIKDEHGWQILDQDDRLIAWAPSRDKARKVAQTAMAVEGMIFEDPALLNVAEDGAISTWADAPSANGDVVIGGEVLPPDDSPEAVAARHAWDVHQKLRQATLATQIAWVAQATYLYEIYEERLWEKLGDKAFESFDAYLADPDTDIEVRWGYNLVAIYKQLVIERGVEPEKLQLCQVSKVTEALPAIRRQQVTIDEALSDIQTLSKSALKTKLSGRASSTPGKPDTKTKIETDAEPQYGKCPTCGQRAEIDPDTGAWKK